MKVLHCPTDVAGQAWVISRAQRKYGIKSDVMVYKSSKYYNYKYEYNFCLENFSKTSMYLVGFLKTPTFLLNALKNYDIFHFHTKSILPKNYDAFAAKKIGKKIVFHFHGCEVRLKEHGSCSFCQKMSKSSKLSLIKNAKKLSDLIIVSTPDLLDELPDAVWINNSIDIEKWKQDRKKIKEDETIKILHSASDRLVKGTVYIESAVEKLKKEGYNVKLLILENTPNIKVKEFLQHADISVDQLIIGWYGVFAIESMALGIPTCAYIRKDLEKHMKNLPIVNVNPRNLYEKLRILVEDEKLREKLGRKSIKFVIENHDSIKNAKKIIRLYKQIL
ncbi:MAG: glycosyltransferase [Candidatus Aenigmatarchaeota archaeon]